MGGGRSKKQGERESKECCSVTVEKGNAHKQPV